MYPNRFALGFVLVLLLTYAKSQLVEYWVPIEFSFFLIFLILRNSSVVRALIYTFVLSLGLDLILQVGQLKGLGAIGQLMLVYMIMQLKRSVVPVYHDFFLLCFFTVFYVANYYINLGLSAVLDNYYPSFNIVQLIFFSLFHTACFGAVLLVANRFSRGEP